MSATPPEPAEARRRNLAVCLRTDAIGLLARRALSEAGVAHIVLKGRAFAHLLYDSDWARTYRDTDLLVARPDIARAGAALHAAGFARPDRDYLDLPPHYAQFWLHQGTGGAVDLHWSLPGPAASPEHVWAELSARTTTLDVAEVPATVLDATASAFMCALHVAQHGPQFPRPLADLERALDRLPDSAWTGAIELARCLAAEEAFAAGLNFLPAGRHLVGRWGWSSEATVAMWLKQQDDPNLWSALLVDSIVNAGSVSAQARELLRWAFPPAPAMRSRVALARRGKRGLAAAYAVRGARVSVRVPGAIVRYIGARRAVRQNEWAPEDGLEDGPA